MPENRFFVMSSADGQPDAVATAPSHAEKAAHAYLSVGFVEVNKETFLKARREILRLAKQSSNPNRNES